MRPSTLEVGQPSTNLPRFPSYSENFLQHESNFESITVTKLLVIHGTTCIKWKVWAMGIIFPLIPLSFLWVYWFELNTTVSQSQAFFQNVKNGEKWPTFLSGQTQLLGHFLLNGCHSQTKQDFNMKPSQMKLRIPSVHKSERSLLIS